MEATSLRHSSLGHELRRISGLHENGLSSSSRLAFCPSDAKEVLFGEKTERGRELERHMRSDFDHLLPFQIESIVNTVYRPTTVVSRTLGQMDDIVSKEEVRVSLDEDIGVIVVNDLPSGSGKTLMCAMAGILFSRLRKDDVVTRAGILSREQRPDSSWGTRTNLPGVTAEMYRDTLVVMCPRHLVHKWKYACEWAASITSENIHVHVNPRSPMDPGVSSVCIFDNVDHVKRCDIRFVPCIVVDEYLTNSPHNMAFRNLCTIPIYGRLILSSANAGCTMSLLKGSSRKSFMRKILGSLSDEYSCTSSETRKGLAMATMSTLSSRDRESVCTFMTESLSSVPMEIYKVRYAPSARASLFAPESGVSTTVIEELVGPGFHRSKGEKTIGDIRSGVVDALREADKDDLERKKILMRILRRISEFLSSPARCPVCLEEFSPQSSATILSPCWHFACRPCMEHWLAFSRVSCPVCRVPIDGTSSGMSSEMTSSQETVVSHGGTSQLSDHLMDYMRVSKGVGDACAGILSFLMHREKGVSRVLIVTPDRKFEKGLKDYIYRVVREDVQVQMDIQTIRIRGTRKDRVTSRNIQESFERFTERMTPRIKVLCINEDDDLPTAGIDLHQVTALVCIGSGRTRKRLGRLARIPLILRNEASPVRCFYLFPFHTDTDD